jgi:transposase
MIDHFREQKFLTAPQGDMTIYESMLPHDHKLCQLVDTIDFEIFRPIVEKAYSQEGQPTGLAMISFKMEVLKYFYNLSDRAVVDRLSTDVAFRWFLRLPIMHTISDHTFLTRFRARLGKARYEELFQQLVAQARKAGVVKDQLRLKDATHVLANISIPSTIAMVSQIRERLLGYLEKIDAEIASGYQVSLEAIRTRTKDANDSVRLNERLELLGDIVKHARGLLDLGNGVPAAILKNLTEAVELAEKILDQKASGTTKREIRSVVDPDAMRGKHGEYYDGYMLDVCMDADSELITAINVLSAGGNEAQGAIALIEQERVAHKNSPQELSIDGAGFDGAMIRELESPAGPAMTVFTPPKKPREDVEIPADQFEVVTDADGGICVRCPEGKLSQYTQVEPSGTTYRFSKATCSGCPLASRCHQSKENSPFGRSVKKSEYQAEHQRIRDRSQTERFAEVRKIHPAIERKLNELVNHHGARRSRYRGIDKVPIQMLGTGLAVNMKRLIKLTAAARKVPSTRPAAA